ncbi:hypothetical protein Tco_1224299, partial [Tanacetum coccineum]
FFKADIWRVSRFIELAAFWRSLLDVIGVAFAHRFANVGILSSRQYLGVMLT